MRRLPMRGGIAAGLVLLLCQERAGAVPTNPINNGAITVKLVSTGSINTATAGGPLDLAQPVGDANRLFVATHGGQIRLIKNGALASSAFADIKAALSASGIALQG